ncbi:MAG: TIGR01777 family oxidoreductase [Gammaproteobacteria bacterium]|nr:TIGR01777 family oxidoreductase [Gammaproteobacteria bacterium]
MRIIIGGATGMIGKALVNHLSKTHELILLGRSREKITSFFSNQYPILTWDDLKSLNEDFLKNTDVIINLTGENIGDKRWSLLQKEKIIASRVNATKILSELCAKLGEKSPRLLNAGGIGIYGFSDNAGSFTEESPALNDPNCFLSTVGNAWENELFPAENNHVNVVKMRFGVVLAKDGGALKKMLPAFKWGLGAVLGNGQQSFSWVSINDLVRAVDFIILHSDIVGPVNIVSPGVVSQKEFAKSLAKSLHRPCFLVMPERIVHFLFGEMGDELLLKGQCVKSEKLLKAGFEFQHPTIDGALF